jgi:phenylpyruvate tautomerase PptA (4-oxalocrotonate tautomerase family)
MPYLMIQTNVPVTEDKQQDLVLKASRTVSKMLGKPERYVMVALEAGTPMAFAGSTEPLIYLELKSINLPEDETQALSATLAVLFNQELGVPSDRIYIEFANAKRHMWGWDGGTF